MPKAGRPKTVYDGILAEPIPRWTLLTRPSDDEVRQLHERKMRALFAHYDLDPTNAFQFDPAKTAIAWSELAWHLAKDHVPGFNEPPQKRGKPSFN
ncbi:hypothetical protein [Bradyrhizobium monzae]|uniref:hypothetical protein n=1 Tax=Bradyrhizobium sp. Oc8 TaxID=2876780 RepID=UPI001F3EC100|nr:hypothetical protein [Bradyrhizobium sp. Oc8]